MPKLTEKLILARSRAPDLESVRKLNCWASEIDNIDVIKKLKNVEIVSLSVNNIKTLEPLCHCKNMQDLYIRKNDIKDLNEICYLKKLPKLRVLWLADNPCAEEEKYRVTVLKNLPNLQKLDNVAVTEDEINAALEEGIELTLPEVNKERVKELDLDGYGGSKSVRSSDENGSTSEKDTSDKEATSDNDISASDKEVSDKLVSDKERDSENETNEKNEKECENVESNGENVESNGENVETNGDNDNSSKNSNHNSNGAAAGEPSKSKSLKLKIKKKQDPATLSLEETNRIRESLGLKPIDVPKHGVPKKKFGARGRNAHIVEAVLLLIKDLDSDSLEEIGNAIKDQLESS